MTRNESLSRRSFVAMAAAGAVTLTAQNKKHIPVGLLIYAVLADWKKDFNGTLTAVAEMGYEGVELTQYESWTPERAKEARTLLDFFSTNQAHRCRGARSFPDSAKVRWSSRTCSSTSGSWLGRRRLSV